MSDFDTGVDEPQDAAVDGTELDIAVDDTLAAEESAELETIDFSEFFEDDATEKVVDSGDDNPPPAETETKPEEQKPTADDTGILNSKAFAARLKQETEKIRREYEQKYAQDPDVIDAKARKLMEQFPDDIKSLDYAKHQIQQQMAQSQTAQPTTQEPEADAEQQRFEAWQKSLTEQEPMVQMALRDPNMTVKRLVSDNPVFAAALKAGNTPMQALKIMQAVEPLISKQVAEAKSGAQNEMLTKVRQSNSRAVTPVSGAKGGGKPKSSQEWANHASMEDFDRAILEAERQGKVLKFDD